MRNVHEIRVCSRCHRRPMRCNCANALVETRMAHGRQGSKTIDEINARTIVTERVLSNAAVEEVVEILATAANRGKALPFDHEAIASLLEAARAGDDLTELRRAMLADRGPDRHSHLGTNAKLARIS